MRNPVFHFLLLGALLFCLDGGLQGALRSEAEVGSGQEYLIEVTPEKVDALRSEWIKEANRVPDERELGLLVANFVDEEVLFREALRAGFQYSDTVVRRRLVRNMRFVTDNADKDEDALFLQALDLGMERSDLVVRRRLVYIAQRLFQNAVESIEPSDEELETYLSAHRELFSKPSRLRLSQVYLSAQRHGEDLEQDARKLRDELNAVPDPDVERYGDPLPVPKYFEATSKQHLTRILGPEFAEGVYGLEVGSWQGPLRSAYGLHLVYVEEVMPGEYPELEGVRDQLREAVLAERRQEALVLGIEQLRSRYEIRIVAKTSLPPVALGAGGAQ